MRRVFNSIQKPVAALLLLSQTVSAQQHAPMSVLPMRQVSGGHSLNTVPARIPQPRTTGYANNGADLRLSGATGLSVVGTSQSVSEEAPPPIQVPSSDSSSPGLFEAPPGVPVIPEHTGVTNPVTTTNVQQWSFNFQNAPWVTVLRTFAREAGYSLQLAADPNGDFTFYDENLYSAVQVLDIFNDHLMSNGHILVREGNRLTLTSATADIPGNLIPFVAIQRLDSLGRNELASVAIPLRNTDAAQAVEELRQLQSPLGQVKALTNSGRVIVTDTGSYLRRMRDLLLGSGVAAGDDHAYVYQLRHAQADDVAKAISDFLNQQSSSGGTVAPDGSFISSGGSGSGQRVVAEKTTNSLLVRGTTEEMGTIQRLICDLDRSPRQVLVQALLVEVELGNTNELGVELGFQDSVLFDRSVVDKLVTVTQTTTAPNGTQTSNQNIISRTAAPGFNFNNQPLGNNVAANPTRIGPQGLSNFGVGRVNGDLGFGGLVLSAGSESVNLLLRALDAQFNIDVLSRPQVRAIENHEAFIQIGQQVPVVDGVAITPVGSANPVIRQDQAGIILKVTPRISPDGRVQLDVNAEKSAFNLAPGTGVPIFTDATNGNVIEAPIKDITTADTTVSVQSGQTIVLGGMITNDQTVVVRKVPWLGDIPIIGRLFRYDLNRHKRKELLVFLTPIVLEDDGHAESLKARESGLIHMPPEAFSFGDNLTGSYTDFSEMNPIPDPTLPEPTNTESSEQPSSTGDDILQPHPAGHPYPAGPSGTQIPGPQPLPPQNTSGGYSSAFQSTSAARGQTAVPPKQGGQIQTAGFQEKSATTPEAKKSLWTRSPNFRGFTSGRNRNKATSTNEAENSGHLTEVQSIVKTSSALPRNMNTSVRQQLPPATAPSQMHLYQHSRATTYRR